MKKKKYIYLLALLPFILVAFMYEIIPLAKIIVNSFQPNEGLGFTLENYQTVFTQLLYQKAIINSIKISLISAAAGIVIAFFGAKAAHDVGWKTEQCIYNNFEYGIKFRRRAPGFCLYDSAWKCGNYGTDRQNLRDRCAC